MKTPKLENIKIAYKLAWQFSKCNTYLEVDELISEALLGYSEALNSYDIERGVPLSGYIYRIVKNRLIDFVTIEQSHLHTDIDTCEVMGNYSDIPGNDFDLQNITAGFARSLAEMVLRRSDEFTESVPKLLRREVREMAKEEGWKDSNLWDAIRDMKTIIR